MADAANAVPRGIEVLVKKAAVDAEFRTLLLERRAAAAEEIGLHLDPAEGAMLNSIPASLLEGIIARTTVSPMSRAAFLGKAAAVMLVALGTDLVAAEGPPPPGGIAPDRPGPKPTGITADRPPGNERFILYSETNYNGEPSCGITDQTQYDAKLAATTKANRVLRQAYLTASRAWSQDAAHKGVPFPMKLPQLLVLNRIASYSSQERADEMLKRRQEDLDKKLEQEKKAEERRLANLSEEARARETGRAEQLKVAEALFDKELQRLLAAPPSGPAITRGTQPDVPPTVTGIRPGM